MCVQPARMIIEQCSCEPITALSRNTHMHGKLNIDIWTIMSALGTCGHHFGVLPGLPCQNGLAFDVASDLQAQIAMGHTPFRTEFSWHAPSDAI